MEAENKQAKFYRNAFEWVEFFLFALLFVVIIFTFLFKSSVVEGESMYPTLEHNDFIVARSLIGALKPGDIVVIDSTSNYGKPLIKRVIALGGDVVDITPEGAVTVNGEMIIIKGNDPTNVRGDLVYPLTVPDGCIFVMGDNRGVSKDSRYSDIGFIDIRSVVGKEMITISR